MNEEEIKLLLENLIKVNEELKIQISNLNHKLIDKKGGQWKKRKKIIF